MWEPKVNDVADLIITRYGALDCAPAAAARQALELFVRKSLISLNSTHLRLLNADNDKSTSSGRSDNPPSHNWARLMAELFGAEHRYLLDFILDPVVFGDDPQRVFAVDGNHRISPIKKIVAATGVFLVAEANRMQCWLDDAEVEPATVHEIQRDIVGVTTCSVALNRSVSDGTWADVLAHALAPEMVGGHGSGSVKRAASRYVADDSGDMRASESHRSAVAAHALPGFDRALEVLRRAADTVPAYRDFLSRHGVAAAKVRTPEDFRAIPPMTKANYLQQYPLKELMWNGDVTRAGVWSTSSGSSGRPTYWPRNEVAVDESELLFDRVFRRNFESHRLSTLVVVGFAMGKWIGGTYTYSAMLGLRRRGHRLSVITPGLDTQEIVASISTLGPSYDQVVLAGYPPFLKDVLDEAPQKVRQGLRILVWGENISENWRNRILEHRVADVCAVYGTADAGFIGHETPATIAVRNLARDDSRLSHLLFGSGESIQPTFVEYDPQLRYLESASNEDDNLLLTVDSAIPLIRYGSIDRGQVLTGDQVDRAMRDLGARLDIGDTSSAAFLSVKVKQSSVVDPRSPEKSLTTGEELDSAVAAAAQGDRASLSLVLEIVRPLVVRYCRARVGSAERGQLSADDVAQEVCLAVMTALPRYQDQGRPFMAFVYAIASHKVADAHRNAGRNKADPMAEVPDGIAQYKSFEAWLNEAPQVGGFWGSSPLSASKVRPQGD